MNPFIREESARIRQRLKASLGEISPQLEVELRHWEIRIGSYIEGFNDAVNSIKNVKKRLEADLDEVINLRDFSKDLKEAKAKHE